MEYNKVYNAKEIIAGSKYAVKNAEKYKGKWNDLNGTQSYPFVVQIGN